MVKYYSHNLPSFNYYSSSLSSSSLLWFWLYLLINLKITLSASYLATPTTLSSSSAAATSLTNYAFGYDVIDQTTGDLKSQHEIRNGDTVEGHYSFLQPDGNHRIVHYKADKINGFVAIVKQDDIKSKGAATATSVAATPKSIHQITSKRGVYRNPDIEKLHQLQKISRPLTLSTSDDIPDILPVPPVKSSHLFRKHNINQKLSSTSAATAAVVLPVIGVNSGNKNLLIDSGISDSEINRYNYNNNNRNLLKPKRQYIWKMLPTRSDQVSPTVAPIIYQSAYRVHYAVIPLRMAVKPVIPSKYYTENPFYSMLRKIL